MTSPLTCRACGNTAPVDQFDIVLACPGNVFCTRCGAEINADSGRMAPLCGDCDTCRRLKADGAFREIAAERARYADL